MCVCVGGGGGGGQNFTLETGEHRGGENHPRGNESSVYVGVLSLTLRLFKNKLKFIWLDMQSMLSGEIAHVDISSSLLYCAIISIVWSVA